MKTRAANKLYAMGLMRSIIIFLLVCGVGLIVFNLWGCAGTQLSDEVPLIAASGFGYVGAQKYPAEFEAAAEFVRTYDGSNAAEIVELIVQELGSVVITDPWLDYQAKRLMKNCGVVILEGVVEVDMSYEELSPVLQEFVTGVELAKLKND